MKFFTAGFLLLLVLGLAAEIYIFWGKSSRAAERFEEVKKEYEKVRVDTEKLQADLHFFARPENLEKELRARFNYRKPDEKLIIIVPGPASTSDD